jgi:peptidoglycan/LPS O-acetylase OafA/YrhL
VFASERNPIAPGKTPGRYGKGIARAARMASNRIRWPSIQAPLRGEKRNMKSVPSKIPSLDGVRAISFLIVFVAHAGLDRYVPGAFGLYVFFILSGYLITTLLIREDQMSGFISLPLFYARRTLRIFPPLYTVIGLALFYLWVTRQLAGITFSGVMSQLLYYSNYDNLLFHGRPPGVIPGLGPLWSLAVEEHFYLLFPPLAVFLLHRLRLSYQRVTIILLSICLADLAWRIFVVVHFPRLLPSGVAFSWAEHGSDTRADSILFGCALAFFERTERSLLVFESRKLQRVIVPGCLVILLSTFTFRSELFRATARYTLQGVALAPLLYYVVHQPRTLAGKLLNSRLLSWIGAMSYSLYLVHYMALTEIQKHFPSLGIVSRGAIGLAISIILAEVIHVAVETPTGKLRGRMKRTSASTRVRGRTEEPVKPSLEPAAEIRS